MQEDAEAERLRFENVVFLKRLHGGPGVTFTKAAKRLCQEWAASPVTDSQTSARNRDSGIEPFFGSETAASCAVAAGLRHPCG